MLHLCQIRNIRDELWVDYNLVINALILDKYKVSGSNQITVFLVIQVKCCRGET